MSKNDKLRQVILERDHYKCSFCGKDTKSITRIIPRSLGGRLVETNCFAVCKECADLHSERLKQTFKILKDAHQLKDYKSKQHKKPLLLFTDASSRKTKRNKLSKVGIVIKAADQQIVYSNSIKFPYEKDTNLMELMGILTGVRELIRMKAKNAIVYSDSQSAVNLLNNKDKRNQSTYRYYTLLHEIQTFNQKMRLSFIWIGRNYNKEAHQLTENIG
jgi:ribonuclease HI